MKTYVSSSVTVKLDEYVEFLMRTCLYNIDEAEIRRWEVEYQINQRCNPILMKASSSGILKFKSVLQRQEIERFVNNRSQLMRIIKRRRGNRGNTQWNVDYIVSNQGNVYITAIKCYNTFSESLNYNGLQQLINECVSHCLRKYLRENINKRKNLFEARRVNTAEPNFEKWKNTFDIFLNEMIQELQSDYLNSLGLSIRINNNYIFNGPKSKWFAVYERRSQQILNGIISIGINYPLMYSEMCKRHIDKDKFNIEAQARITIGHEIGHGLVDYIKNLELGPSKLSELPNVTIVRKCGARKEETLVEEFGEYQFVDATGVCDSILSDALEELNSM